MDIKTADFIKSSTTLSQCPVPDKHEFAFIGRSNVGKSSLINMLTGRKSLAKISGTPGKTQTINHFIINNEWYLVDLPGYGYAKVSKSLKGTWDEIIRGYLSKRENLKCVFVLIDIRHNAQKNDLEFMYWLGSQAIPFVIIFTKHDKLKPGQVEANLKNYKDALSEYWEEFPSYFITSSASRFGRDNVLDFIQDIILNNE